MNFYYQNPNTNEYNHNYNYIPQNDLIMNNEIYELSNETINYLENSPKYSGLFEKIEKNLSNHNKVDNRHVNKQYISLLQFCRLFTLDSIPIIDFVVIYVLIYLINLSYFRYDFKIVIILAILVTICINLIFNNDDVKLSLFIILAIIGCMYYLIANTSNVKNPPSEKSIKKLINGLMEDA